MYLRAIRLSERLATGPAAAAGLAVLHAIVALRLAFDPATLHDEGLLSYGCARALGEDFFPTFFFQKTRPLLSLLYLPAAQAGLVVFLVAHVLVAAAAIPLVAAAARALGVRNANVAALAVAFSPLFAWCGPTGLANSDGVTGLSLALYLVAARRNLFAAGLVLGGLPWIRYELAPFVALLALHTLWRERSRGFLLGLALWPALYLVGGAIYHRDLLWALHFPPAVAAPMPGNRTWLNAFQNRGIGTLAPVFFGLTPLVVLLPWLRLRALPSLERLLLGASAFYLGLFSLTHLVLVPFGQLWILGFSPRYALQVLPFVAILAARASDAFRPEEAPRRSDVVLLAALTAIAVLVRVPGTGEVALWTLAGAGAAITLGRLGTGLAPLPLAAATAVAPLLLAPAMQREGYRRAESLAPLVRRLEELPSSGAPPAILTNVHLLAPYAARTGALRGRDLRYLLAADHLYELRELTNPANGQRERVLRAVPRGVFGDAVDPTTLTPAALAPGTLFVLHEDERNELILPAAVWGSALRPIHAEGRFSIAELRGDR